MKHTHSANCTECNNVNLFDIGQKCKRNQNNACEINHFLKFISTTPFMVVYCLSNWALDAVSIMHSWLVCACVGGGGELDVEPIIRLQTNSNLRIFTMTNAVKKWLQNIRGKTVTLNVIFTDLLSNDAMQCNGAIDSILLFWLFGHCPYWKSSSSICSLNWTIWDQTAFDPSNHLK